MKGILLAGGAGTRLHPLTLAFSKQLLPLYNKPMVYYPLSTLMLSGIREILIITTPEDQPLFKRLLGDGERLGLKFQYLAQSTPGGIAQAFLLGESFIGKDSVALALGDNIFYGESLGGQFKQAAESVSGATIFGYRVNDPERYGVVEFNKSGEPIGLVEKPKVAPSPYAVVGLYFYDNQVIEIARGLKPSARGELEITDVNREYLKRKALKVVKLGRGTAWLDTGTYESLLQASHFVQTVEERQGWMIACLEEIAFRRGYITRAQVEEQAKKMANNHYGRYLLRMLDE